MPAICVGGARADQRRGGVEAALLWGRMVKKQARDAIVRAPVNRERSPRKQQTERTLPFRGGQVHAGGGGGGGRQRIGAGSRLVQDALCIIFTVAVEIFSAS